MPIPTQVGQGNKIIDFIQVHEHDWFSLKNCGNKFVSPLEAERQLKGFNSKSLNVVEVDDDKIQFFTNNNAVVAAFVGSSIADEFIHKKLDDKETDEFFPSLMKFEANHWTEFTV